MEAALFVAPPAWDDRHRRRLAACMAISAAVLLPAVALFEWPPAGLDWSRLVPLGLEVTIQPAPERPESAILQLPPPLPEPEAIMPEIAPAPTTAPAPEVAPAPMAPPANPAQAAEQPAGTEPRTVSMTTAEAPEAQVDWYAELERAAVEVSARAAAEPQSMHPEFDELRRIAALRYGPPQTSERAPPWQAEKDPYGRTLLKRGNTYTVLEDPRLFNQYAFETFERHMLFVSIPIGRPRPKDLPWVETIRARYEYMREPDELPPIGTPSTTAGVSSRPGTVRPATPPGKPQP